MTSGILSAAEEWTGHRPVSCPWRAFWDPLVREVLAAYEWFESGQLAFYVPEPSHRLVEGLSVYHRARSRAQSKKWALERQEAESKRRTSSG